MVAVFLEDGGRRFEENGSEVTGGDLFKRLLGSLQKFGRMSLTEQEGALRRERSMSGRAIVLAEGAPASSSGGPSHRDSLGLGGRGGRVPGGSQRPRQQAKKHPEPLRRAVADCLSSSHHVSPTEALRTVQVFILRL